MKVTVLAGQSLADIAVQVYGSAEGMVALAKANRMGVADVPVPGRILDVPEEVAGVKGISEYYKRHRICPATNVESDSEIRLRVFTGQFTTEFK